jgi:hypothetical protein
MSDVNLTIILIWIGGIMAMVLIPLTFILIFVTIPHYAKQIIELLKSSRNTK